MRNRLEMRRQIVTPYFFGTHIPRNGLAAHVQLFRLDRHLAVFKPDIGVELSNEAHVGYRPAQPDMFAHHAFPRGSDLFASHAAGAAPPHAPSSFPVRSPDEIRVLERVLIHRALSDQPRHIVGLKAPSSGLSAR